MGPEMRPWAILVVFIITACAVGMSRAAPVSYKNRVITHTIREPGRVEIREKIVTKTVYSEKPDGYMTADQCRTLSRNASIGDLMYHFGWPADDNGETSYNGHLLYPIREDHDNWCSVDMWRGEIDSVNLNENIR